MARKRNKKSNPLVGCLLIILFGVIGVWAVWFAPRNPRVPSTQRVVLSPTPTLDILVYDAVLYAKSDVVVRGCPAMTCVDVGLIGAGDAVTVTGMTDGEVVVTGYDVWFVVEHDGGVGYVYQTLLTNQTEASATPAPTNTSPVSIATPMVCPNNCAEARSLGWSAEMAGQCDNLDRDNDGVACYGD
ncbi:MAG: hypothetical protein MUE54_10800 [Anaerolineae bacterium]|jgi:hypothetical protein|nr:hypothetical protein [Anaerolineae bacterium]